MGDCIVGYTSWTDAKCFRLIKDLYIELGQPVNPEYVKVNYKGAYNYIYEKHESFENFARLFDLNDFTFVDNFRIDDGYAVSQIREAYMRCGEPVNPSWLNQNGYSSLYSYLRSKGGEEGWLKACDDLGIADCVMVKRIDWTNETALAAVLNLYEQKGEILISADFEKYNLTGLRGWITKRYQTLEAFFAEHGIEDKLTNMAHVGKELWSYGIRFQLLVKEAVELMFDNVIYDKWFEFLNVRPDFILGETGVWIDAKLSSFAYFTDETVNKYTAIPECKELWLVYLRGHEFKKDNDKVVMVNIENWFPNLERIGRKDLIDRIVELRDEVVAIGRVSKDVAQNN